MRGGLRVTRNGTRRDDQRIDCDAVVGCGHDNRIEINRFDEVAGATHEILQSQRDRREAFQGFGAVAISRAREQMFQSAMRDLMMHPYRIE